MSSEYDMKTMVLYLSGVALALFYLVYMPFTTVSGFSGGMDPIVLWIYYFALVVGLLFPIYYAMGQENMSWMCLGISILLCAVVWMNEDPTQVGAGFMTLIVGVLFFITPLIEPRVGNWDLVRNALHFLKGFFIILATGLNAGWILDDFIGATSWNHLMPSFIYIGGGLAVVFGFVLLVYGLMNILKMFMGDSNIAKISGDLARVFYVLMVLVFLFGITYNIIAYIDPLSVPVGLATPIAFFGEMAILGNTILGSVLLLILYLYGMDRILEKARS
ncbi:MAG: hypothetical protein ACFFAY_14780 [Promethearchaeota archaeon]